MRKFTLLLFVTLFTINVFGADYFWVGNSGNWSDFASHWATSSGGSTFHTQVPTTGDDVFFDANSFTMPLSDVSIDANALCKNMNWTGVINSPNLSGWSTLEVFGSLTFDPNMTITYNGMLVFRSSEIGNTVDFSTISLSLNNIEFKGSGEWSILSDINSNWLNLSITEGSVNFNNHNYNISGIQSWGMAGTRTINLGSSSVNVQWLGINNSANLIFIAGTSTLNLANNWFDGLGLTYYDVNFNLGWTGEVNIQGSNTFHNLGLSNSNVTGVTFEEGKTNTVYGINFGADCLNRKTVKSSNDGQVTTIKKISGSLVQDYLIIKDINVIGGATFTTNNGINLGNVTNWTINSSASRTLYWVGDAGDWNDPTHWSLTSGGAFPSSETCAPTDADDVMFDVNSFTIAGQTVGINSSAFCKTIDFTGVSNNPEIQQLSNLNIYGSLILDPSITLTTFSSIYFYSNIAGNVIQSAGKSLQGLNFYGTGDFTLQDNLTCSSMLFYAGVFNSANFNITTPNFYSYNYSPTTLNLGSSILDINNEWNMYSTGNLTLNSGTSTINYTGNYFYGGNKSYYDVNLENTNSTTIYGGNTFNNLLNKNAGDLYFENGKTNTINVNLTSDGNCSDLLKIYSTSTGDIATISIASGVIDLSYISLKDITATGGATFNAVNSIDEGNVVGFNFSALSSQDYYWIGGNGNWSDASHWSLSSGGLANIGGCIPNQTDNVFFDANSGSEVQVNINQIAYCNNMDWTGVTASSWLWGNSNLNVFGDFILAANVSLNLSANLVFKATDAGNTINVFNKTLTNQYVIFEGTGEWTLQSGFSMNNNKYLYFNSGSLNTNNFDLNLFALYSWGSQNRNLTLGSSSINTSDWQISDGTNMTIVPNTSTLNVSQSNFYGGGLDYNDVIISSSGWVSIYGSNTYNNLNVPSATSLSFEGGTTHTLNTLNNANGTGCDAFFNIQSTTAGFPANLVTVAGIYNGNWLKITDVTAAGGATFNATNSQGIGTVTGWNITGTAPTDFYWIADGGDWTDALHWSLTSGGVANPSGCIPTINDNVFFDANSFPSSNQTLSINSNVNCATMDWTQVTNNPKVSGSEQITINGSMLLSQNMDLSNYWGIINLSSSAIGNNVKTENHLISGLNFTGSGEYTLNDDLNVSWNNLNFNNGTLNTNDNAISIPSGIFATNSVSARTLNLGNSFVSVQSWDFYNSTGLTLNAGASIIELVPNAGAFEGGNLTYNNVIINANTWGNIGFYGSNTFNTLEIKPGTDIIIESGSTQNTTNLIALGTSSNSIKLHSDNIGSQCTINQVASEFCGDRLNLQDIAATGNTFYAGENSVDLGNNSGWTFAGVTANDQYPAEMCEDVAGAGTVSGIDLTSYNSAIDGGNLYTITWYNDAILSSLVVDPTNVTVSNLQNFYALVDNGTCTNVAEVTFSVNSIPSLSFLTTNVQCYGENNGAIDMTVSGNSPYLYSWDNSETTEDINSLVSRTYNVTVIDSKLCENTGSENVTEPSEIIVNLGVDNTICTNDLITLDAQNLGLSYVWNDLSTNQTLDVDASLLGTGTFDYSVTVTDGLCFGHDSIAITVDICSEISDVANQFLNVYPNPSSNGIFTINLSNEKISNYNLKIIDAIGKEILNENIIEKNHQINLNKFEAGIYYLKVATEKDLFTEKLIISKH
jgi:hypothetical protein